MFVVACARSQAIVALVFRSEPADAVADAEREQRAVVVAPDEPTGRACRDRRRLIDRVVAGLYLRLTLQCREPTRMVHAAASVAAAQ